MARGTWVVRVALFIAVAGTVWGMTVMVSAASGIDVTLLPADTPWTGTWAAVAPQAGGTTFERQTLREIVHTSMGGSLARVRLSNVFGTHPLTVADVHIADSAAGSSIKPATDRTVTFGGNATTTIPPGGSVTSDAIPFQVAARSEIAVSVYLPQTAGPATEQATAPRDNYVAHGDVSGSTALANASTTNSYYFLTSLDVYSAKTTGAIVSLGTPPCPLTTSIPTKPAGKPSAIRWT
jgi:hypothetical protein